MFGLFMFNFLTIHLVEHDAYPLTFWTSILFLGQFSRLTSPKTSTYIS